MADFTVSIKGLKGEADVWKDAKKTLNNSADSIKSIRNSLSLSGEAASSVKSTLKICMDNLEKYGKSAGDVSDVLKDIASEYKKAESAIRGTRISDGVGDHNSDSYVAVADGSVTHTTGGTTLHADGSFLSAEGSAGKGKFGYSAEGSAAVLKGQASAENEYAKVSAKGSVLEAKGDATFGIPKSFGIGEDEAKVAGISASASVAVASGEIESRIGSEQNNIHAKAEGSVVGADAKAELGVVAGDGTVGLRAGVDAEAYWAKGEVSTGFSILGIDIDIGAEGMVGVQAEAYAEVGVTGFDFDLGLGPIGLDIKVDWSDIDLIFWD